MTKFTLLALCVFLFFHENLFAQCAPASAYDFLDINNVRARINNGGDMWWDLSGSAIYEVPKGSGVSSMFAGALWIGGIDALSQLKVAAQTYRQNGNDFFAGPLDATGNVTQSTCQNFDRIWKINKSTLDSFVAGQTTTVPASIAQWPGKGNPNLSFLPDQDVAPFIDANSDGLYNPADGDYPSIKGDQALWFIFNDKGNDHTETGGVPFGFEIKAMAYSYNSFDCLKNTTFYEYTITNKSPVDVDSLYIGLWSDPDLGCYTDDYIGCDTTRNMGIVYNSEAVDGGSGCSFDYGNQPPLLAQRIINVEGIDPVPEKLMSHFGYYVNDVSSMGNPQTADDYYQYLKSHFLHNSVNTNFAFPSDPTDAQGWSECTEGSSNNDKRMIVASGPFSHISNVPVKITYAIIWIRPPVGTYPCPSFQMLQDTADCVVATYNQIISGINDAVQSSAVSVFPNPSSKELQITLPDVPTTNYVLSVKNILGEEQRVSSSYSGHQLQLDVSSLTNGVYLLQVFSENKKFHALFVKD